MPSIRRGTRVPPKKIFRNGVEIKKVYRGTVKMWEKYVLLMDSGTIAQTQLSNSSAWQEFGWWTAPRSANGLCYISASVTWTGGSASHQIRVTRNGVAIVTSPEQGSGPDTQSVSTLVSIAQGDTIRLEAITRNFSTANNRIAYGSWSIQEQA